MVPIGGIQKSSLIDYPGCVSAVIFTHGCNLRCPYCHNPELVVEKLDADVSVQEKELLSFLDSRRGKLDGVVITGGEPLIHKDLDELIKKIKELGYLVKLDSNGFFPERLDTLVRSKLIDYIAMDVKYPKAQYIKFSGGEDAYRKISKSIEIIMNSGLLYEFRTTFVKNLHEIDDVKDIGEMIEGSENYYIQNFRPGKTINPTLTKENSFTDQELKRIRKIMKKYVKNVVIR